MVLAVTGCGMLMAGRDGYGKGQQGMVPLSEKWIGICLWERELGKGIGQDGSGKVFWFFPPAIGSIMADVCMELSLMAFVFPRLTCVICF